MTRLLLVRHGQSVANEECVFAGFSNPPLTEKGLQQADCTAKFVVENYHVDAIYASDLQRAYRTGLAAAEMLGLPVIACEDLREIFAGQWEGCQYNELAQNNQDFQIWLSDIGNCQCPGGESVAELAERIYNEVCSIAEKHDGQTVLIATHATPIRTLMWRMAGGGLSTMKNVPWVSNASVTEIHYENGVLTPVKISQDAHLKDLITQLPRNA